MRIIDAAALGEAVCTRRKELKYTQRFLSEVKGLSISFISDFERGKETIEIGKALFLIHTLGLDISLERRGEGND